MARRTEYSDVVDDALRVLTMVGVTGVALLAPNAIKALDKPLRKYFKHLDEKSRNREYRQVIAYLRKQRLITDSYEHGLQLTEKARKRLNRADIETLGIAKPKIWDKHWRMVIYDIPESQKIARNQFAFKLRQLGFEQLQRSVWVHPFPCEREIEVVASRYNIDRYVTYFQTSHINNEQALKARFTHLLK